MNQIVSILTKCKTDYSEISKNITDLLNFLELDKENFKKDSWNPFKEFISPGDCVVIKPNFVLDKYPGKDGNVWSVIVHPAVIKEVCKYAFIALSGRGRIIIADAPQHETDFNNLMKITELPDFIKDFKKANDFQIEIYDLRQEQVFYHGGVISKRVQLLGDSNGYALVNIGEASEFKEIKGNKLKLLRGADYDYNQTILHHSGEKHEYLIARAILSADAVISIPKLKTHKKSGLTLNIKNMIGINGNKNFIPHFRYGQLKNEGDEYLKDNAVNKILSFGKNFSRRIVNNKIGKIIAMIGRIAQENIVKQSLYDRGGNWYGNDTVWRGAIDLNKILLYADKNGIMRPNRQRKYFSIVDGIIAGDGNGPLAPREQKCGALIAGFDPIAVDMACSRLVGFDYKKIPIIANAGNLVKYPISSFNEEEIIVKCDGKPSGINFSPLFNFFPSEGWKNHIEL